MKIKRYNEIINENTEISNVINIYENIFKRDPIRYCKSLGIKEIESDIRNLELTNDKNEAYDYMNVIMMTLENNNIYSELLKLLTEDFIDYIEEHKSQINDDLLYWAQEGDLEAVMDYLEDGADINYVDKDGSNILEKALDARDIELVEFILKNGFNVNQESIKDAIEFIVMKKGYSYAIKIKNDIESKNRQVSYKTRTIIGIPSGLMLEVSEFLFKYLNENGLIFYVKRYKPTDSIINNYCYSDTNESLIKSKIRKYEDI